MYGCAAVTLSVSCTTITTGVIGGGNDGNPRGLLRGEDCPPLEKNSNTFFRYKLNFFLKKITTCYIVKIYIRLLVLLDKLKGQAPSDILYVF